MNNQGIIAWWQGDYAQARALYEESLAIDRELGDTYSLAGVLGNLGLVAQCQTDYGQARLYLEESLSLRRAVGDQRGIANTLLNLGVVNVDDQNRQPLPGFANKAWRFFERWAKRTALPFP